MKGLIWGRVSSWLRVGVVIVVNVRIAPNKVARCASNLGHTRSMWWMVSSLLQWGQIGDMFALSRCLEYRESFWVKQARK